MKTEAKTRNAIYCGAFIIINFMPLMATAQCQNVYIQNRGWAEISGYTTYEGGETKSVYICDDLLTHTGLNGAWIRLKERTTVYFHRNTAIKSGITASDKLFHFISGWRRVEEGTRIYFNENGKPVSTD